MKQFQSLKENWLLLVAVLIVVILASSLIEPFGSSLNFWIVEMKIPLVGEFRCFCRSLREFTRIMFLHPQLIKVLYNSCFGGFGFSE